MVEDVAYVSTILGVGDQKVNKTEMAIALVVINTLGEKNRLFKKGEKF